MSWQATAMDAVLRVAVKPHLSSAERTYARVERLAIRPMRSAPPRSLQRAATVTVRRPAGWPVYTTTPRSARPHRRIVYLHGGAYIYELVGGHWGIVRFLTTRVPARCDVPIYPLAPHATAAATVPAVAELVAAAIDESGAGEVVVAGDSAGGGLALAAAQHLRDTGRPQPGRLLLISPWLDVTMSDPRQAAIEPQDAMLGRASLTVAGRMYAGDLDVRDPLVSPLFGKHHDLAPITVLTGTHDLLHPDAVSFAERARAAGADVGLHVAPGMGHDHALLPTPEGRAARRILLTELRG